MEGLDALVLDPEGFRGLVVQLVLVVAGALFCFDAEAAEHVVGLVVAKPEVLGQVREEDLPREAISELPDVGEAGVAARYACGIRYGDGGDGPVGHPASSAQV
jgi:hypothetical protein